MRAIGHTIGTVALEAVLLALPVMLLWDWLMPEVFPGAVASGTISGNISFFHALGLALLASLLKNSTSTSRSTNKLG